MTFHDATDPLCAAGAGRVALIIRPLHAGFDIIKLESKIVAKCTKQSQIGIRIAFEHVNN